MVIAQLGGRRGERLSRPHGVSEREGRVHEHANAAAVETLWNRKVGCNNAHPVVETQALSRQAIAKQFCQVAPAGLFGMYGVVYGTIPGRADQIDENRIVSYRVVSCLVVSCRVVSCRVPSRPVLFLSCDAMRCAGRPASQTGTTQGIWSDISFLSWGISQS